MTLKKYVDEIAVVTKGIIEKNDFNHIYNNEGAYSKAIETEIEIKSFGNSRLETEVLSKRLKEIIGDKKEIEFRSALNKKGWRGNYRLDVIKPKPLILIELKVSKLDVIRGKRKGKCLYDIGPWAKDIARLQTFKDINKDAKCFFILIGIHKQRIIKDPANSFFKKLKEEYYNDLNRDKPELLEKETCRKNQKKIIQELLSIDKSKIITSTQPNISIIGLDIDW